MVQTKPLTIFIFALLTLAQAAEKNNPCYNEYSEPVQCEPDFMNAAFGRKMVATSTCSSTPGTPEMRLCRGAAGKHSCDVCSDKNPHPASYITDLNNPTNETCWVSAPFSSQDQPTNVSLTLALGNSVEVTYVSLLFCGERPDSTAIYKSADNARTWQPFQYYSSDCRTIYGVHPGTQRRRQMRSGENRDLKAFCSQSLSKRDSTVDKRIVFSTIQGRASSQQLQDWITATHIKIEFNRLTPKNDLSISDNLYYSVSDLVVGGRVHCSGHGYRYTKGPNDRISCVCQHNTEGDDCSRCKSFFVDRPWQPATRNNNFQCEACKCNQHAKSCTFSSELYELSGFVSGGVCQGCKHNTAGRYCHYCKSGFRRDMSKPINHRNVCILCRCHPIGAAGKTCNQTTGQCPCKDGVTGLTCNRCAPGYQQSRSPIAPCVKIPNYRPMDDGSLEQTSAMPPECVEYKKCRAHNKKINLRRFCKKDYVIVAEILTMRSSEAWSEMDVLVSEVYAGTDGVYIGDAGVAKKTMWLPAKLTRCNCPYIQLNTKYLIMGKWRSVSDRQLVLDEKSNVLRWKSEWDRRMKKFRRQSERGKCERYGGTKSNTRRNVRSYRYQEE